MPNNANDLLTVLVEAERGTMSVQHAARVAGLHPTTIRRKIERLRHRGPKGLTHGLIGRPSNRRINEAQVRVVTALFDTYTTSGGLSLREFHASLSPELRPSYATLCRWLVSSRHRVAERVGSHVVIEVRGSTVCLFDRACSRSLVCSDEATSTSAARSVFSRLLSTAGIPLGASIQGAELPLKRRLQELLRALGVELYSRALWPLERTALPDLLDDSCAFERELTARGSAFVCAREEQWRHLVDQTLQPRGEPSHV